MELELGEAMQLVLAGHAPLAALVVDPDAEKLANRNRIWPVRRPQGSDPWLPCITFRRVGGPHESDLDGAAGIDRPAVQVNCYARTYRQSRQLAAAVRDAVHGFSDRVRSDRSADIWSVVIRNEIEADEPADDGSDTPFYRVIFDLDLVKTETIPTH